MKKIHQFFLWVHMYSIRVYLFWSLLFVAVSVANPLLGYEASTLGIFIIIAVSMGALSSYYSGDAEDIRYAEDQMFNIEHLLENPNMEGVALSGLWQLCTNTSGKYEEFFTSPKLAERFHDRFLVALDKFKAANINQYKGVRSLDFAQALRDAAEELEQVEPSERKHFHVVMLEKLSTAYQYVIETFVKPQEEFFDSNSQVATYSEYIQSIRYRYDYELLTPEELCKKVHTYLDAMSREEILNLFASIMNGTATNSSEIRLPHLTSYLKLKHGLSKDIQYLCVAKKHSDEDDSE